MSMDLAVKTYRYDPHHFEAGVGPVAKARSEEHTSELQSQR